MKFFNYIFVFLMVIFIASCIPSKKEMTPEDFITIENEILNTDLTPDSKEAIAKKYNYTLKQYEDYSQKVEKDPALKAKVGDVRLKGMKGAGK
jgi:hypothetical protein